MKRMILAVLMAAVSATSFAATFRAAKPHAD